MLFSLTNYVYAFSFFGPKNYEDSLIEGMKGVNSDASAGAVIFSCRQKFPDSKSLRGSNRNHGIEYNDDGQRVCRVYWDGSIFKEDDKSSRRGFIEFDIVYDPTQVLYIISIPKAMNDYMKKKEGGLDKNVISFIANRKSGIDKACNL